MSMAENITEDKLTSEFAVTHPTITDILFHSLRTTSAAPRTVHLLPRYDSAHDWGIRQSTYVQKNDLF